MGKRNKKKNKWRNKNKHILFVDLSGKKVTSSEVNDIAHKVFGSLYYSSSSESGL